MMLRPADILMRRVGVCSCDPPCVADNLRLNNLPKLSLSPGEGSKPGLPGDDHQVGPGYQWDDSNDTGDGFPV